MGRFAGLQITVGYRTLADQNLLVSDEKEIIINHKGTGMVKDGKD